MSILVTTPEAICFSRDRILWKFQDDLSDVVPGLPSEAVLAVGNPIAEGAILSLRWNDKDIRFVAKTSPANIGDIPTYAAYDLATLQAYIESLVAIFQKNYFINEDFVVSADSNSSLGATIWFLKFTARKKGSQYNIQKVSFGGGSAVTPTVTGTNDSTIANNSVFVEIWMQEATTTDFKRIYLTSLPFDSENIVELDIAEVLHSNLASELPDFTTPVAQKDRHSCRKYYLRYAQAGGENFQVGELFNTAEKTVLMGGFDLWKKSPVSVTDHFHMATNADKYLMLRSRTRVIRTDEPVFVSWVNFGASDRWMYARATITFTDGTTLTTNTPIVADVLQHEKLVFGVGFRQLNLIVISGIKDIVEYTVTIHDNLNQVSEPYRLIVDYGHREYVRYFAYVNSYGAIETVTSFGKNSAAWKVFGEQAEKVLPYTYTSAEAQLVEWNKTYQDSRECATGFMPEKELKLWLDLFLSGLKYRVIKGDAYAITINSDTVERGADGQNLFALTFEYQFARVFDALSETELEGEDEADYIPANTVLAGQLLASDSNANFTGLRIDPYPIQGSSNAVSSDGVWRALQLYQKLLPVGDTTQYIDGTGNLRTFATAVNAAEKDPTVPSFVKTINSSTTLIQTIEAADPALNVTVFDGHTSEYYTKQGQHPTFSAIPDVTVYAGQDFTKYVDLAAYITSYHQPEDLIMDLKYENFKVDGLNLSSEGLVLTITGNIAETGAQEQIVLVVSDLNGNQQTLSLTVKAIEQVDERPTCPRGPSHWMPTPLIITGNTSLTFRFDGDGIYPIHCVIMQDGVTDPIRDLISDYNGLNTRTITFDALPAGTYQLGIEGEECKSVMSLRPFTIGSGGTGLAWTATYPKYQESDVSGLYGFYLNINQTGNFLTQIINLTTGATIQSTTESYIAGSTYGIVNSGIWPDAIYRINVGALSADITVGTPPAAVNNTFLLRHTWNGSTIASLTATEQVKNMSSDGWNVSFESTSLGYNWDSATRKFEVDLGSGYNEVTTTGTGYDPTTRTLSTPSSSVAIWRLFGGAGVDSRYVNYLGASLNRTLKARVTYTFKLAGNTQGTVVGLFRFSKITMGTTWKNNGTTRVEPLIPEVQVDGVNVQNNNVWAEPWASSGLADRRIEYSVDGKLTWQPTSAVWDANFAGHTSLIWLLNSSATDLFPTGSVKTLYLRDGMNPDVVTNAFTIDQSSGDNAGLPPVGTYKQENGGRVMTYQGSPTFNITLDSDGKISDTTPGLTAGTPNTIGSRTIFYQTGYYPLMDDGDEVTKVYKSLQDVYLPDGIWSIMQMSCDSSKIADLDDYIAGISGWPVDTGVNLFNTVMSQITLTLRTTASPGPFPSWLTVSRLMNFPTGAVTKPINYKKVFATESYNADDLPAAYHAKGVHTQTVFDGGTNQPDTFRVWKWPWDGLPVFTNSQLYDEMRPKVASFGLSKKSVILDEYPENQQGEDPTINDRAGYYVYKGLIDKFRETEPTLSVRDTNLYGPYGNDNWINNGDIFSKSRAFVVDSLDSKVHYEMDPSTGGWRGFPTGFYPSGHREVRNVNVGFYMYNGIAQIPYVLIFANERVKIGTKTYGGVDMEVNLIAMATSLSQSLVVHETLGDFGVEYTRTGDNIPYTNGTIMSKYNTPIAANCEEMYTLGFWSRLIINGIAIWGGDRFGRNTAQIKHYVGYTSQEIKWTPTGGTQETYVSGQNGAPINSTDGLQELLYTTAIDAAYAGFERCWQLDGRIETLYGASYVSTAKTFTAVSGVNGYHLNGFGVLNKGILFMKDALDQRCGIGIIGVGTSGKVGVYYNGFLSPHEYEDDVTITVPGIGSVNIGRVYGRQTVTKLFS